MAPGRPHDAAPHDEAVVGALSGATQGQDDRLDRAQAAFLRNPYGTHGRAWVPTARCVPIK